MQGTSNGWEGYSGGWEGLWLTAEGGAAQNLKMGTAAEAPEWGKQGIDVAY